MDVPAELAEYDFVVAQLLLQRGIATAGEAERFLKPELEHLGDPGLLPDMDKAAERIRSAVERGESIVVYGDYDVDGVTSSTILVELIRSMGGVVDVYLPERLKEGYGLNIPAIEKLAATGVKLIVAVDNGTAAVEQIARANELGVDVIVVDHHEPHDHLPAAYALINPKLAHSQYPFRECCAAGVAYHVARRLVGEAVARQWLDLAAIGTVADVVPLVSDNRVFAVWGVRALAQTTRPGLLALIEAAGLQDKTIDVYAIGFQIGPRLNAAGRIDHAKLAFDLLNAKNREEAMGLAKEINDLNLRRQEMTDGMLAEAKLAANDLRDEKILLVGAESWSIGVAGIVAGRLVEAYNKPAIVFEYQAEFCKGSARSVDDVHIVELLAEVSEYMAHYGGHAKAAGLSVVRERFDEFRIKLQEIAQSKINLQALRSKVKINILLDLEIITPQLLERVLQFAPFGFGNPNPVFAIRGAKLLGYEPFGSTANFLKLRVGDERGNNLELTTFDDWRELVMNLERGDAYDVAFTMSVNEWKGRKYPQNKLVGIRSSEVVI